MAQQFVFPVAQSQKQKDLINDMAIITNELGLEVIEVKRLNRAFRGGQGVLVPKWRPKPDDFVTEEEPMPGQEGYDKKYTYELIGGKVDFVRNPFGKPYDVAYLIDDKENIGPGGRMGRDGAPSGAITGWNREWLAAHMGTGSFQILDAEVAQDVSERSENRKKYLAKTKDERDRARQEALKASKEIDDQRKGAGRVNVSLNMPDGSSMPVQQNTEDGYVKVSKEDWDKTQSMLAALADKVNGMDAKKPARKKPGRKKKETLTVVKDGKVDPEAAKQAEAQGAFAE